MPSWLDDANDRIEREAENTIKRLKGLANNQCIEYDYVFDTFRKELNKLFYKER